MPEPEHPDSKSLLPPLPEEFRISALPEEALDRADDASAADVPALGEGQGASPPLPPPVPAASLPSSPPQESREAEQDDEAYVEEPLFAPSLAPVLDDEESDPSMETLSREEQALSPAPLLPAPEPMGRLSVAARPKRRAEAAARPRVEPVRSGRRSPKSPASGSGWAGVPLAVWAFAAAVLVGGAGLTIGMMDEADEVGTPERVTELPVGGVVLPIPASEVSGSGSLRVLSYPAGLPVWHGERSLGTTPLTAQELPAGLQEIRVGEGSAEVRRVFIRPDDTIEIFVQGG